MTNYKLSIVIPVFNKWNFTKACLNDLLQLPDDHQIIIVDNGSSDETAVEIKKIDTARLNNYRFEQNQGFAKGCNQGWGMAESDNILFLNNDIRVKSNFTNWTDNILNLIQDDYLVGPTGGLVDPSNNFQFVYETNDPKKKINYMSGWCLASNRFTWSKLYVPRKETYAGHRPAQIFSEEFGLAYYEDSDLGFRAKKLKINFKLTEIPVIHFGKVSSGQINTNALYSKARQIFIQKWGSK